MGTREVTNGWTGLRTPEQEQSGLVASFQIRILWAGEAEQGNWGRRLSWMLSRSPSESQAPLPQPPRVLASKGSDRPHSAKTRPEPMGAVCLGGHSQARGRTAATG